MEIYCVLRSFCGSCSLSEAFAKALIVLSWQAHTYEKKVHGKSLAHMLFPSSLSLPPSVQKVIIQKQRKDTNIYIADPPYVSNCKQHAKTPQSSHSPALTYIGTVVNPVFAEMRLG